MAMNKKKQRGQAMAEYQVLIPSGILVSILLLLVFGGWLGDLYEDFTTTLLDVFNGNGVEGTELVDEPEDVCVDRDAILDQDGGSYCDQSDDCDHLEPEGNEDFNTGTHTAEDDIDLFVIKAGRTYHIFNPGFTDDGCMYVEFDGDTVSWEKVGDGAICQDVSHVQAWQSPLCP